MRARGHLGEIGPPLSPGVDRDLLGEVGPCPFAVIELDLDAVDSRMLCPGGAPDTDVPGRDLGQRLGNFDAGGDEDGCFRVPPAVGPVGGLLIEAGDLEFGHPFRRGDESVESGDDEAGGEPVDRCERFAVHSHRQECGAVIGQCTDRGRGGESVEGVGENHIGVSARLCSGEEFADGIAEPGRIADELSADGIGYAGERDVVLFEGQVEHVVHRQGELVLDHAVDAQRPLFGVDDRW